MTINESVSTALMCAGVTPDMLNSVETNVKVIDEAITSLFQVDGQYVCVIVHKIGEHL